MRNAGALLLFVDQNDRDERFRELTNAWREWERYAGSEFGYKVDAPGNVHRRIDDNWRAIDRMDSILRGEGGRPGLISKVDRVSNLVVVFALATGALIGYIVADLIHETVGQFHKNNDVNTMPASHHRIPHSTDSQVQVAAIAADLAKIAYGAETPLGRRYRDYVESNHGTWIRWRNGNAAGIACRVGDLAIVSIAGTDDRRDLVLDVDCSAATAAAIAREHDVRCYADSDFVFHRGFTNYAMLTLNALRHLEFDLSGPDVILCGHSLGGAAATLLPWFIPAPVRVFSFGSPKPLGLASIDKYPFPMMRVIRNTDPMPLLPMCRFQHPIGVETRVIRYPGDLATHRNLVGHVMKWVNWLNPARCVFAKIRIGHDSGRYASDMNPNLPWSS